MKINISIAAESLELQDLKLGTPVAYKLRKEKWRVGTFIGKLPKNRGYNVNVAGYPQPVIGSQAKSLVVLKTKPLLSEITTTELKPHLKSQPVRVKKDKVTKVTKTSGTKAVPITSLIKFIINWVAVFNGTFTYPRPKFKLPRIPTFPDKYKKVTGTLYRGITLNVTLEKELEKTGTILYQPQASVDSWTYDKKIAIQFALGTNNVRSVTGAIFSCTPSPEEVVVDLSAFAQDHKKEWASDKIMSLMEENSYDIGNIDPDFLKWEKEVICRIKHQPILEFIVKGSTTPIPLIKYLKSLKRKIQ